MTRSHSFECSFLAQAFREWVHEIPVIRPIYPYLLDPAGAWCTLHHRFHEGISMWRRRLASGGWEFQFCREDNWDIQTEPFKFPCLAYLFQVEHDLIPAARAPDGLWVRALISNTQNFILEYRIRASGSFDFRVLMRYLTVAKLLLNTVKRRNRERR
jgi:hypothetical protein